MCGQGNAVRQCVWAMPLGKTLAAAATTTLTRLEGDTKYDSELEELRKSAEDLERETTFGNLS